jgi:subtilisin family serine protease
VSTEATNESATNASDSDPDEPPYNATELRKRATNAAGQTVRSTAVIKRQYIIQTTNFTQQRLKRIKSLGASINTRYRDAARIEVAPDRLPAIQKLSWVSSISPPAQAYPTEVSEGVAVINANDAHAAGYTGEDVDVGVLDGGFNPDNPEIAGNVESVQSLHPAGITGDSSDHGTAVSEIVVDAAPDSDLHLVNYDDSLQFEEAVDYLIRQDVDVIVDSWGYYDLPQDGTSIPSQAVARAEDQGVVVVSSAGNQGDKHWLGPARDGDSDSIINVDGRDERLYLNNGDVTEGKVDVFLRWDGARLSEQDYDLGLYREEFGGDTLVAQSAKAQDGFGFARESITTTVSSGVYYLAITNFDANGSQSLELMSGGNTLEPSVPHGSILPPADGSGVIGVGAFNYDDGHIPDYSSHGPTDTGRLGVDVIAPTRVSTDTYPSFAGTSAAAPHVAGLAALALDKDPSLSPQEVTSIFQESSVDAEAPRIDFETGYGAPGAQRILANITGPNSPPIPEVGPPQTVTEGSRVTLDGSGSSDPDGDQLTYEWEQTEGPAVSILESTTASSSFVAPDVDTERILEFRLTVSDGRATSSDTVQVTVKPDISARVQVSDQSGDGTAVTVDSVTMSEGGFVVVHDSSLLDGRVAGSVVGSSGYLAPGQSSGVEVSLDEPLESNQPIIAMLHRDTNDNQQFDFPNADGPYTANGSAVTNSAQYTLNVQPAEVALTVDAPETATPGSSITVTTELENGNLDGAGGGSLELISIPEPLSVTTTNPIFLGISGNQVPAAGETVSQSFELAVPERTQPGQELAIGAEGRLDSTERSARANGTATIRITEPSSGGANLSLSGPSTVTPGDMVTLTATLNNTGVSGASGGFVELVNVPKAVSGDGDDTKFLGFGGVPVPPLGESHEYQFELGVAEDASPGNELVLTAEGQLSSSATDRADTATTRLTVTESARFDTNDQPGIQRGEVVDAIVAYNTGAGLNGQPVSRTDVVDVIVKFNS